MWSSSGESSYARVDVLIQSDVSSSFFLPMVSQDCSLVFFWYINRNSHCLVRFVQKKNYLMSPRADISTALCAGGYGSRAGFPATAPADIGLTTSDFNSQGFRNISLYPRIFFNLGDLFTFSQFLSFSFRLYFSFRFHFTSQVNGPICSILSCYTSRSSLLYHRCPPLTRRPPAPPHQQTL